MIYEHGHPPMFPQSFCVAILKRIQNIFVLQNKHGEDVIAINKFEFLRQIVPDSKFFTNLCKADFL